MFRPTSERAFARLRRIYGKPALLSGSLAFALYALIQIDRFHGSIAHTALNVVVGVVPAALAGCLIAVALVPLRSIPAQRAHGARGLAASALKVSAVLGIVATLVVVIDHLGRAA